MGEGEVREKVEDKFQVAFGPRQCPHVPGGRCWGEECELWVKEVTVKDVGLVKVARCSQYVLAVEAIAQRRYHPTFTPKHRTPSPKKGEALI